MYVGHAQYHYRLKGLDTVSLVPLLALHGGYTWCDHSCIVDQNINSPFLFNDLLYNFFDLFILRNIKCKLFNFRLVFEIADS